MLDLGSVAQALSRCILFSRLSDDALASIARGVRSRRFRRGDVLFHQGDPGDALFVVLSGAIKVVLPSEEGDEAILTTLHNGDFLGELALVDGASRSATAVALEPTETLMLSRERFRELLDEEPELRDGLLLGLAGELRRLTAHVGDLHFLDLTGRVAAQIVRLARDHGRRQPDGSIRLDGPITQGDLASMVGATRQSVNKLLGMLVDDGLVRADRDSLVVLDLEGLTRAARR